MSSRAAELRRQVEARMAALTPEERARLDDAGSTAEVAGTTRIGPRPSGAPIPLTRGQDLLWLLDQTTPGLTAYNVPAIYGFQGHLEPAALQQALNWVVARHEILRTAFLDGREGPRQEVRPPAAVPIVTVDLRGVAEADREAAAAKAVQDAAQRVLRLDSGRLLQATLITLAPSEQILVLLTHHIASDAWSLRIMERELAHAYDSYLVGSTPSLPEPALQFGDFAVFAAGRLMNGRTDRLMAYWREQLADAPRRLDIPVDRPRPALPGFEGARCSRGFGPELSQALGNASATLGASRFMVLLAAFHALLARWTDQDDTLVAIPMAERERAELAGVVGYLVNTLPIRVRVGTETTFAQMVAQVREALLGADEHRDLPFETIAVEVGAAPGGAALQLQTSFAVAAGDGGTPLQLAGLVRKPVSFAATWAKFEVSLTVHDQAASLRGLLEYRTDLFDEATAERVLACYETLLEGALRDLHAPVRQIDLVTDSERRQLLDEWNDTDAPLPPDTDVPGLIRARALAAPDAIAVTLGSGRITYGELDDRAGRLARHLQGRGVGPEVRVGVCLEPSRELPVALLGILQAGGTVVPLDPAYPLDRLGFMIAEGDLGLIITSTVLAPELPTSPVPRLLLDAAWESIARGAPLSPLLPPDPDRAAYLLFTSGSTGRPKAVVLHHRGLLNHHLAVIEMFGLSPTDRVPQLASLSFDISIEEMFPIWVAGGTVILRPDGLPLVGSGFNEWLDAENATVMTMATAHWQEWTTEMAASGTRVPPCIRLVVIGGEAPSGHAYANWCSVSTPSVRWINTYGPTEATCCVTTWEPSRAGDAAVTDFPIGRPFRNIHTYVVDRTGRPVPVGFPGELRIGGAGVARGYFNHPGLTAERFLPDQFHPGQGHLLYRTGDRVRYRRDGTLEFLGRFDDQVKLHGYRIEPGEIENALRGCAGVAAAVAMVREDRPGQRNLVAYYVPSNGPAPAIASLRTALLERLPGYMMPAQLISIASIPMTPNGKIDRKALPAPEPLEPAVRLSPETTLESVLIHIWEGLLPGRSIDPSDDFFALGGHSLLAARMVLEIAKVIGLTLPLEMLYRGATVRDVARHLLRGVQAEERPGLIEVQPGRPGVTAFFMAHGDYTAGGFYCRQLAEAAGPDQPFYAIQPYVPHEPNAALTIEAMVALHAESVRRVQPRGPYRLGGYCIGGLVAYELARRLRAAGEQVELLLLVDSKPTNAKFLWIRPLIHGICFLTERSPTRRADRFAYLMARVWRLRRLRRRELVGYVLGFPGRLIARRLRRLFRRIRPLPSPSPRPLDPNRPPTLPEVDSHYARAMLTYFPGRYDGRVDILWATDNRRPPTVRGLGWDHLARQVELITTPESHVAVVTTSLPGVLAAALKRLNDSPGA